MGTALVKRSNTLPAPLGLGAESLLDKFRKFYQKSDRLINLLVGMPSYDKYIEHMKTKHPDQPIMTRKAFFNEALEARYSGVGGLRCC